uniref:Uncharacterized protein n=1 Tax=viral metagenome TaxID=1070528 RepID=A0A6M3IJ04_9ZZZZ
MADKVFKEKEKITKVFATQTDNLLETLDPDKEIIFNGDEGFSVLEGWIKKSKEQGRDLTIKCGKVTFKNRGAK